MLYEAIKYLFPDAVPRVDFSLRDDGDGAYIESWNIDAPQPTPGALREAAAIAARLQETAARRAEILVELDRIDLASARPLRAIVAGSATDEDRARLAELDQQAATLRAELASLA
jgi:hypothetical protein